MTRSLAGLGTWLRNGVIAYIALTLFAALATRLLQALGAPIEGEEAGLFGDPWAYLAFAWTQLATRPDIAWLCVALTAVFGLAALGVLALTGAIPPLSAPRLRIPWLARHGFERWDIVRQRGLLRGQAKWGSVPCTDPANSATRASGLALGAARRLPWARPEPIAIAGGRALILGERAATETALLAAMSSWPGAVILVGAGNLASLLPRQEVLRFALGRPDSIRYNPLLAIRGDRHAWADATHLARAYLATDDPRRTQTLAVLILDQLLAAPLEQRHLAAIRRRLAAPSHVLRDICAAWDPSKLNGEPPHCDIARTVLDWRAEPHATLDALHHVDAALDLFADGAYAEATSRHQLRLSELVAGARPRTLVLSPPTGEARRSAPLMGAILAQMIAECAAALDIDWSGRPKMSDLLIVLDEEMAAALRGSLSRLIPPHAARNGCSLLVAARTLSEALAEAPAVAFDAIAALGPQTSETADHLSRASGAVPVWRRDSAGGSTMRDLFLPTWTREERPAVAPEDLTRAAAESALLLLPTLRPIEAKALAAPTGAASFVAPETLGPIEDDWTGPPLARAAPPVEPSEPAVQPISARIRKALAGPIQRQLSLLTDKPTRTPPGKTE